MCSNFKDMARRGAALRIRCATPLRHTCAIIKLSNQHQHFSFGSQRRQSHSSLPVLPFFSLLASFVSSHLLRDSLCTALQTRKLWIWSTGLLVQLTLSSQQEVWVLGNLFVRTGRSQPAIRGMRGRGGKSYVWRLFPWRTLKISTYSVPW